MRIGLSCRLDSMSTTTDHDTDTDAETVNLTTGKSLYVDMTAC